MGRIGMDLGEALAAAIDALEQYDGLGIDGAPLQVAQEILRAPWRVAVVGRVAAGKSTLVQWLSGAPQPVGLGGVTTDVVVVEMDDVQLLDTPGIDDPDMAIVALQSLLETVDEVYWVVDGLQPGTASERDVLAATLVEGTPLRVVVSKIDLVDAEECDAVVHRVRTIAAAWRPRSVTAHDLRFSAANAPPLIEWLAPSRPSPRQHRRLAEAFEAVRHTLQTHPPPLDLERLLATWNAAVRGSVRSIEQEIDAGRIQHKTDALAALAATTTQVDTAIRDAVRPLAPPRLPQPDPPTVTTMGQVLGGLSGQEGATRVLKAGAARWLAEGQLVLREWWGDQVGLEARVQRRRDLDRRIDALIAAL